jgi:outer membrane protein OmpA-like peptidoglycan-associated protein
MKKFLSLAIFLSLLASSLHAEISTREEWRLMLAIDAGGGILNTTVGGEANKSGFAMAPKILLARETQGYTFDFGVGISFQDIYGTPNTVFDVNNLKMTALLLELGIRGEIIPKIFFGPVVNVLIGNDVSLREPVNPMAAVTSPQSGLFTVGLQALYDLSSPNTRIFLGMRATTSLNITDRQYTTVQGVIQVGLPFLERNLQEATPAKAAEALPAPAATKVFEFALPKIYFVTGSDELDPKSKTNMATLGAIFAKYQKDFDVVVVEGHTDKRGSYELNKDLSQERAESVKDEFIAMGVATEKITASGFSFDQLIDQGDTEAAHSKNRRAVIQFHGLKEDSKMKEELAAFKAE